MQLACTLYVNTTTISLQLPLFNNSSTFERFQLEINDESLYDDSSPTVGNLLVEMSSTQFQSLVMKEGGTQLKLIVDFPNGGQALYKPMRFPRNQSVSTLQKIMATRYT